MVNVLCCWKLKLSSALFDPMKLSYTSDAISLLDCFDGTRIEEATSFEKIAEIRNGLNTDDWLNLTEQNRQEFKNSPKNVNNPLNYLSIVFKAQQKFGLVKTYDFMFAVEQTEFDNFYTELTNLFNSFLHEQKQLVESQHQKYINDTDNLLLNEIFLRYSDGTFINAQGLSNFYSAQNESKSKSDCETLIYNATASNENSGKFSLNLKEFYKFFEDNFTLFNSKHEKILHAQMGHPMSHYFIASSHNSYLSGNQLSSASSYEMYRQILLDGCRCIEIDVWHREGELVVTHGFSFTSLIYLEKVLQVINEFAFVKSNCPLILSIENHLVHNAEQENKMAKMMRDIFGEKLYLDDVDETLDNFPLLQNEDTMNNRIFIKCKRKLTEKSLTEGMLEIIYRMKNLAILSPNQKGEEGASEYECIRDTSNDFENDFENYDNDEDISDEECPLSSKFYNEIVEELRDLNAANAENEEKETSSDEEVEDYHVFQSKKIKLEQDFLNLINYFEALKFSTIEKCLKFKYYQMFSLEDSESKKVFMQDNFRYRQFTSTHMARTYPRLYCPDTLKWVTSSNEIFSFNYNPIRHWNAGAQMVALNYQIARVEMDINAAMFSLNGGCGYVLKPEYLLFSGRGSIPKILKIKIISGNFQNCLKTQSSSNLKVTTRVFCPHPKKEIRDSYIRIAKETTCQSNKTNPVWNAVEFEYKLDYPELSFVQFSLNNGNNGLGSFMIAAPAIQNGYRWIGLNDHASRPIPFARIYLHVNIRNIS